MSDITPSFKIKDPTEILVYEIDWGTNWLAPAVTISTSTWTITGPDAVLTKDSETIPVGLRSTRVRLSAGTLGARYRVTNRVTTNETPSQTGERTFEIMVQNR